MNSNGVVSESVKNYYGKVLQSTNDLKTTACCTTEVIPDHIKSILSEIEDEVISRGKSG